MWKLFRKQYKENKIPFAIIIAGFLVLIGIIVNINNKNNLARQEQFQQRQKIRELDNCLYQAEITYWEYMKLNGTVNNEGVVNAEARFWNTAEQNKNRDADNCYRRYNLR
jgi:hypothetical protein